MSSPPSAESATETNVSLTDSSETDGRDTEAGMESSEDSDTELPVKDGGLNANDVIEILSNERRRLLWRYLRQECPEGDLSDASRQIAAWENGITVEEVDYDERKSVYTSLHQFHCPKMEDAGLIEFDKRDSVVRAVSEEPEEFVVEVEPDVNQALSTTVIALCTATGVIIGAWGFGSPVFGERTLAAVLLATGIGAVPAVFVYSLLVRTNYDVTLPDALSRLDT